jgi:hypothetical protein
MKISSNLSRRVALWISCVLLLASCSLPGAGSASGGAAVWLDQPTTASLLPLAPFTLKAHARPGTAGGVTRIEFLVNDVSVGSVDTDASQPLVYAETGWNPSAVGSYTISARAYAGNGSSDSAIAMVCVSDKVTSASAGFSGDCASPVEGAGVDITVTPGAPSGPTVTPTALPVTVHANVLYNPAYYGPCEPSTLKVSASLSGDLSSVGTVRVSYLYDTPGASSPFGLGDVAYDANIMTRQADGTYLWSTNLNTDAARWGLSGAPYVLYVYVEAFDSGFGGISNQAGPIAVPWLPCAASVPPTPTFTPAPADTTPPGINITQINPSDTGYYITGCGPNSITVQAHVTDASGVSNVTLLYQYSGGATTGLPMTSLGGDNYQGVLTLDTNTYNALHGVTGTVTFTVKATDTHGNTATASGSPVTLMYCPG